MPHGTDYPLGFSAKTVLFTPYNKSVMVKIYYLLTESEVFTGKSQLDISLACLWTPRFIFNTHNNNLADDQPSLLITPAALVQLC